MANSVRSGQIVSDNKTVTVDDIWYISDSRDQELRRLAHSGRRGTMELGGENNDGLSQQACTALAEQHIGSVKQTY